MGSIITGYLDSIPEEIKNPLAEFMKETERAKRAERNVYEAIKVIEAQGIGNEFCLGNCLKYLLRAGKKTENPLEDYKKAKWYLERLITNIESNGR